MKMKALSAVFAIFAVLLSDVMCAVVAYDYCNLIWGGKYAGWSAPAWAAYLQAIPFLIGIAVCAVLAAFFRRKSKK